MHRVSRVYTATVSVPVDRDDWGKDDVEITEWSGFFCEDCNEYIPDEVCECDENDIST